MEFKAKLDCPTCSSEITSIALRVEFAIIDGQRYRSVMEWETSCGHTIHDDLTEWNAEPDDSGMVWASITDATSGVAILTFKEGMSDNEDAEIFDED